MYGSIPGSMGLYRYKYYYDGISRLFPPLESEYERRRPYTKMTIFDREYFRIDRINTVHSRAVSYGSLELSA
jgi:hypothetical protein